MKKIITAVIITTISTNLAYAADLSKYPKASNNGQTTHVEEPIIKEAPKEKKSKRGSTLGKVATAAIFGVGSIALFGLWAANEWNCAGKPSSCR